MCIRDYLQSRQVWFETVLHRPAPSASKLAQSLHVPGGRVAKAVLVRAGESYVLAVLPATARIDLDEARRRSSTGARSRWRPRTSSSGSSATASGAPCRRSAGFTGSGRSSTPAWPEWGEIVCVGNTRHEGVRLRYRDYEALESPAAARFAVLPDPAPPRTTHRRAG